jgi:23S rRNA pseudouridine1911/1915/1917 synthase
MQSVKRQKYNIMRKFDAEQSDGGKRLDQFLKSKVPATSRSFLQHQINSGRVTVNSRKTKPDYRVKSGDIICLSESAKVPLASQPELNISVLYEDGEMIVVNKPAGISTHPAVEGGTGTAANWLVAHDPKILVVGDSFLRPGIVHRLDRFTSGVLVAAKTAERFEYLKNLFKSRLIQKEYLAILEGIPSPKQGVIEGHLLPSAKKFQKKTLRLLPIDSRAKSSRTRYSVVSVHGPASVTSFFPETGRTHQIRVHASSIGTPVLGDKLYGAKLALPEKFADRFYLHAKSLSFALPDGKIVKFEAAIPEGFIQVLAWLDAYWNDRDITF